MLGYIARVCVFFFQAEDGIRDLVRSRGLGDVYKRQALGYSRGRTDGIAWVAHGRSKRGNDRAVSAEIEPVSYTHLTLPTSDLV